MLLLIISFVLLVGACQGDHHTLSCYGCVDCKDHSTNPFERTCSNNREVCMKIEIGDHVMKMCGEKKLCDIEEGDPRYERLWESVTKPLSDVINVNDDDRKIHCCETNFCNAAHKSFVSVSTAIILPIVILLSGFVDP